MKKNFGFLVVFLALYSCGTSKQSLPLISSALNESYVDISFKQLESKLELENTFLLYIYSSQCLSCNEFKPIINAYISNTNALVYGIDVSIDNIRGDNELVSFKVTPTFCIIDQGNVIIKINSIDDPYFSSIERFNNFMDNKVIISPMIEIGDEDILEELIKTEEEIIVYFKYSKCGDCIFFENNYLNNYLKLNLDNKFYAFDVYLPFESRETSESLIWKTFTSRFGLSLDGSSLGYQNGVVPTIVKYKNGNVENLKVIYNDIFEKQTNDIGEIESVKIISSYYADAPHIGETYYRNDSSTAMDVYRKETLSFFINKFLEIMEK